ncbi:MAG: phytanoyl-CoA dioxygenase family protein [Gammaproteobacteria bacterium]|nr:phytanoyl-CoA dioxygenase family protein [Gammaproteobacteria bacterium]
MHMDVIARFCDEVQALPEVAGRQMAYYEDSLREQGKRVLSRIENFCPYHEGFDEWLRTGKGPACVAQLFGEQAVLFKEKINFKMPGGDGFKAHQDVQAGWDTFAPLHITLLIGIDPATARNGCLEVAKGHHRRGLLGAMWQPLADDIEGVNYEPIETQPGDALFFDSYCPHRSAPNLTERARRVLYVTYNAASAGDHRLRYYADKRASYPPDCERDPGKQYRFKV